MKKLFVLILSGCLLFFHSCVDRYDLNVQNVEQSLVVEGLITDEEGPYQVRLTQTYPFQTNPSNSKAVLRAINGATVIIADDQGNQEQLAGSGEGLYVSKGSVAGGIRGVVGRTYTVHITTPDGKQYASQPELLKPVPDVDTLVAEFKEGNSDNEVGHYIYAQFRDFESSGDYYRWKWTGAYPFASACENPITMTCTCFMTEKSNRETLLGDFYINGNQVKQLIAFVPYKSRTKYILNMQQYSLTKEAYTFWKLLNDQNQATGSIFDKSPAFVKGNLYAEGDPTEKVMGFFGASSVKRKHILFKRELDRNPVGAYLQQPPGDCRDVTGAVTEAPPGWE